MNIRSLVALASIAAVLAGCSFQNKYEAEAQKITDAVIHNDMSPVKNDLAPGINLTRVQVANWSDELNGYGKLQSIKEEKTCNRPGYHCLTAKFEKATVDEWLLMDDKDKVANWHFHAAASPG